MAVQSDWMMIKINFFTAVIQWFGPPAPTARFTSLQFPSTPECLLTDKWTWVLFNKLYKSVNCNDYKSTSFRIHCKKQSCCNLQSWGYNFFFRFLLKMCISILIKLLGRLDSRVVFTLDFELRYTSPWAVSSSLGDVKLFFGPKHNVYALFMILFD